MSFFHSNLINSISKHAMQYFPFRKTATLLVLCFPQFEMSFLEHLRSVDNSIGEKSYSNCFVRVLLSATKKF